MSDDPELASLRAELAAADRALVEAMNRRIELVLAVKQRKAGLGVPFVDQGQEERVLEALAASSRGPLTDDGLRDLVRAVLALSKREAARAALRRRRLDAEVGQRDVAHVVGEQDRAVRPCSARDERVRGVDRHAPLPELRLVAAGPD